MRDGKARLGAKSGKGLVRVHPEIARVGAHIAWDEAGRVENGRVRILDGGDVIGADAQLTLHVEKGFAEGRALAAHQIAEPHLIGVKAANFGFLSLRVARVPPPDHPPMCLFHVPQVGTELFDSPPALFFTSD